MAETAAHAHCSALRGQNQAKVNSGKVWLKPTNSIAKQYL